MVTNMPESRNSVILQVEANGRITLPDWVCEALLRKSGIRSRRKRAIKKAIKKQFIKALEANEILKGGL